MKRLSFAPIGLFTLAALAVSLVRFDGRTLAAEPLALHPENGRYFVWREKPTILITSGEHYGALLNLDFDYVRYFKTVSVPHFRVTPFPQWHMTPNHPTPTSDG